MRSQAHDMILIEGYSKADMKLPRNFDTTSHEPITGGILASHWHSATTTHILLMRMEPAEPCQMDIVPPGGAMEAPKDPETRPGPPPSATVPLGMGMYCASAIGHQTRISLQASEACLKGR